MTVTQILFDAIALGQDVFYVMRRRATENYEDEAGQATSHCLRVAML